MFAITVYTDNEKILIFINKTLLEDRSFGAFSIHETHNDRYLLVSDNQAPEILAYFTPCYTKDEAINLAKAGVSVLDVDEIIESMQECDRADFFRELENGCVDNIFGGVILTRLNSNQDDPLMCEPLPIKFGVLQQTILHPAEHKLLRNGQSLAINITINTKKMIINHSGARPD
ncbi:hypothetical protein [Marinobacter sp. S6332]|uniref:hypothetical protein n=1 Tax=Marinobacter sp. S6332 TaxID=2926403 RepID=UPI001FF5874D|nr:hypothetical protein [Marinobacter sp. S6332]MCK0165753.1 hypothetical protein [Marinobacter sp. S6332]